MRRAAEWWRRWIPRPETTLLVLALAWTVGAKGVVVLRHAPSGFVASLAQVALPDVQARLQRDGFIAQPMSIAAFTKYVGEEGARWKPLVEKAGLAGKGG